MILTYSLDRFVDDILAGKKITTIREDRLGRWKPGMKIHHWRGNPRNPGKNPYKFKEDVCTRVQRVVISRSAAVGKHNMIVHVDFTLLTDDEIEQLARNDGLTVEEMRNWFVPDYKAFYGRIIHWT